MICVSVGNVTARECAKRIEAADLAEIRLDTMDIDPVSVRRIFSLPSRLIATCRPGRYADDRRFELLANAIAAGAAYVDVEIEAADEFKNAIAALAIRHKTRLIVSYHNYRRTPGQRFLRGAVRDAFRSGADLAKVACMVNGPGDNLHLIDLLKMKSYTGKLIVVGMGEMGRIVRVASLFLGCPFTYAFGDEGEPLAPGQMSARSLKTVMELIRHG